MPKPASGDFIFGIAFQPDGKLVAAGRAGNGTGDIAILRYNFFQKTDALLGTTASTLLGNNIYNQNGSGQALALSLKQNGKKKMGYLQFQNDGNDADSFAIKGAKGKKLGFLVVATSQVDVNSVGAVSIKVKAN
jgi:hypothetical protein